MKKLFLLLGLFSAMVEFTGADFGAQHNTLELLATPHSIKRQVITPMWITHAASLINVTETYDFETETGYDATNTDQRNFFPTYTDGGVQGVYVNETSYDAFAVDSTNVSLSLHPLRNLSTASYDNSNGVANFFMSYNPYLASRCAISDDSRTLAQTGAYFHLTSGAGPTIHQGVLLYRSNTTGNYSGWDGYVYLNTWQTNPSCRISFAGGLVVQLAMLYEIDNYDTGWWVFQKHVYYHVVGIYKFNTTSD